MPAIDKVAIAGAIAFATLGAMPAASAQQGDYPVTIFDFGFNPADQIVPVGSKVTFTNTGNAPHTATANDGSFDTGNLNAGQSKSVTFSTPGVFHYRCTIHPSMVGKLRVTTSPPILLILEPDAGATVRGMTRFRGTVSDPDGNEGLTGSWWIDNGDKRALAAVAGEWIVSLDTTTLTDASHVFHVNFTDPQGMGAEKERAFVVRNAPPPVVNQPPVVAIDSPTAGANLSGTVRIVVSASDPDGDSLALEVVVDGQPLFERAGSSPWTLLWDTTTVPNGPHTLIARVNDGREVVSSGTLSVLVDNAASTPRNRAPIVGITSPADGATVKGFLSIRGTGADPDKDPFSVQVAIDAGAFQPAVGNSTWSFAWDAARVAAGAHTIEARATDGLLTSTIAKITVTVAAQTVTAPATTPGTIESPLPASVLAAALVIAIFLVRRR